MEKAVAAKKRTLREEHPHTLSSMCNLAIRYGEVGRRQEALELTEKVVAARKRTLGEEHPDTLCSMHALAIGYSKVGQRQGAAADGEGSSGEQEDAGGRASGHASVTRQSGHFKTGS